MSIEIVVTNAGRAAIVNAQNTGTAPVTITHVGLSSTAVVPVPTLTALAGEIKRVATISGEVVADDTIHLSMLDSTADAYTLRSLALYLADGTIFAIYGQPAPVLEKTTGSVAALSVDVIFADISAASLTFGDATFVNPPATTERQGVVELATLAEALAGSDAIRSLTAAAAKGAVLNWLLSQDGSGSGLDADMLDGMHASAFAQAGHVHGTMADQNANAVNIIGGAISGVTLKNVQGAAGIGTAAPTGFLEVRHPGAGGEKSIVLSNTSWDRSFSAWAEADGYRLRSSGWSDSSARALMFSVGAAEAMRISAAGNIGLGTANPSQKLHVAGNLLVGHPVEPATYNVGFFSRAPAGGTIDWDIRTNDATHGARTAVTIAANGNIGLGTQSPAQRLHVGGNMVVGHGGDPANYTFGFFSRSPGSGTIDWDIKTTDATFGARTPVTITAGGNVGIGALSPTTRLHVEGPDSDVFADLQRLRLSNAARTAENSLSIGIHVNTATTRFVSAGTNAGSFSFHNGIGEVLRVGADGIIRPGANGAQDFGAPSYQWKDGHYSSSVKIAGNNAWHSGNDGSGSGLDADLLDGLNSTAFLQLANFIGSEILSRLVSVDGSGSGLDADLLDGQQGAYYLPAATFSGPETLSRLVTVDGSGSGLDADLLDGYHASSFDRIVEQNLTAEGGYIVYASGRKECWGTVVIAQDSYATWNLPIAHTSWCHPSFTYTGKAGQNATADNTMFVGFLGAPPYATRWYNAEDATLTIYVRTIGV